MNTIECIGIFDIGLGVVTQSKKKGWVKPKKSVAERSLVTAVNK